MRGATDAPKFKDFILPLVFFKRLSDLNSALFNNHICLNRHANFHLFQNHPLFFRDFC
ncbi:MAG: type I restriction-modification system subunit M N-terminal domain-containing protein, partial [Methanothrix sp.]|nr:type I restriction-modification system subunit M N-terminal domain-containing protein [Methanothrix sp.]